MALRELVATSNPAEIALIKSLLDGEGIPYLAQGENFHAVRMLAEPVRFLVPEQHLEDARPLVAELSLSFGSFADFQDGEGTQNRDRRHPRPVDMASSNDPANEGSDSL